MVSRSGYGENLFSLSWRGLWTYSSVLRLEEQIGLAISIARGRKYLAVKYHEMIAEILGTRIIRY